MNIIILDEDRWAYVMASNQVFDPRRINFAIGYHWSQPFFSHRTDPLEVLLKLKSRGMNVPQFYW